MASGKTPVHFRLQKARVSRAREVVHISQHWINVHLSPNRYEKIGLKGLLLMPMGIISHGEWSY